MNGTSGNSERWQFRLQNEHIVANNGSRPGMLDSTMVLVNGKGGS